MNKLLGALLAAGAALTSTAPAVADTGTLSLQQVYDAGGGAYFDVAAVHPYTVVDPAVCWSSVDAFCAIETVRKTMVANGDAAKELWLTEYGWSSSPLAPWSVDEPRQADFVAKAHDFGAAGRKAANRREPPRRTFGEPAFTVALNQPIGAQRHRDIEAASHIEAEEAGRGHADDVEGDTLETNGLLQHRRGAAKLALLAVYSEMDRHFRPAPTTISEGLRMRAAPVSAAPRGDTIRASPALPGRRIRGEDAPHAHEREPDRADLP